MKLEASLLRPIIDIVGNADFCTELNLKSKIKIPELTTTLPGIAPIHVDIKIQTNSVLFGWVDWLKIQGDIGPINPSGPLTISTPPNKDIELNIEHGCISGVARVNPKKLLVPPCCLEKGFKVSVDCGCEVHKDHNYCDSKCKCNP